MVLGAETIISNGKLRFVDDSPLLNSLFIRFIRSDLNSTLQHYLYFELIWFAGYSSTVDTI